MFSQLTHLKGVHVRNTFLEVGGDESCTEFERECKRKISLSDPGDLEGLEARRLQFQDEWDEAFVPPSTPNGEEAVCWASSADTASGSDCYDASPAWPEVEDKQQDEKQIRGRPGLILEKAPSFSSGSQDDPATRRTIGDASPPGAWGTPTTAASTPAAAAAGALPCTFGLSQAAGLGLSPGGVVLVYVQPGEWPSTPTHLPAALDRVGRGEKEPEPLSPAGKPARRGSISSRNKEAPTPTVPASVPRADWRTTVVLQNLPNSYSRDIVMEMLDKEGFAGLYDWVYLPMDYETMACFGYAFLNFRDPSTVPKCWEVFSGYSRWIFPSRKTCTVSWCTAYQGLEALVAHYRNNPVMHPSVPEGFKPALIRDGVRVAMPPPTRRPKAPWRSRAPYLALGPGRADA
eukprot:TRINITY_DN8559_c0_g1_i1.p1 TRINITY_DN8559_c0_g1~~TRINITY_DN8559_c0_g1_i1.p1  ORF type:complete len:431 (+),score=54.56 TRINITY_DN8559_c0_g1_i1:86-1294(+)